MFYIGKTYISNTYSRCLELLLLGVLFYCFSCQNSDSLSAHIDYPQDTIPNALIDSLGELAYEHYLAFEKQPDVFLQPLENKKLTETQQETFIWILLNMAYSFQEHSRYLASIKYYEQALRYDRHHRLLTRDDRLTYIYKPLANNYTIIADYHKAEDLQLQAIQETTDASSKASFYNNLALLYVFKGEHEASKKAALSGLQQSGDNTYLTALLHNTLSAAYVTLGLPDSGRVHNSLALNIAKKLPLDENTAAVRSVALERLSQFQRIDKQDKQAQTSLREALTLEEQFFPKSHIREKANLLNLLGELHYTHGELASAKNYFLQAKSYLDQDSISVQRSNYTGINILENLGVVYSAQHTDSALWYFQQAIEADFAFQQSIRSRDSHLQENLHNRRILERVYSLLDTQKDISQEKLFRLLWLTELTKGRLLWNEINRSAIWKTDSSLLQTEGVALQQLYALRDNLSAPNEIAEIDTKIKKLLNDFELEEQYFSRNIKLPDFDTFKIYLTKNESTTYSYYIHADSTLSIFLIDRDLVSYHKNHNTALWDSIAQFKNNYFTDSPALFNQNPKAYFQRAQYFGEQLLPRLQHTASSTLQLSLDNELHVLPFDALYQEGRFVVQDYNVQYMHTLLMNHFYEDKPAIPPNISVIYRDKYTPPLADLHFVDGEIQYLTSRFKTTVYPYTTLDKQRMQDIFKTQDIIHIAAHTTVDEQQEARLLLHQPISIEQLRYQHLRAPLVVLSACNTASGRLLPSEGLASINREFLSKGIPGVIATHWFANDQVTLDLTQKFYEQLACTKNPIKALANAKRQYLHTESEIESNPWYWANMAYTGIDTKIDLHNRTGLLLKIGLWIMAISLLPLLFTLYKRRLRATYPKKK